MLGAMPNPYQAPRGDGDMPSESRGLATIAAVFALDGHRVEVRFNLLTGSEACLVDGGEVARRQSALDYRTAHTFRLADTGKEVGITCRFWPVWPVRVVVDGQPFIDNLFPVQRALWSGIFLGLLPAALAVVYFIVR
jgi:hypothetical protein